MMCAYVLQCFSMLTKVSVCEKGGPKYEITREEAVTSAHQTMQ